MRTSRVEANHVVPVKVEQMKARSCPLAWCHRYDRELSLNSPCCLKMCACLLNTSVITTTLHNLMAQCMLQYHAHFGKCLAHNVCSGSERFSDGVCGLNVPLLSSNTTNICQMVLFVSKQERIPQVSHANTLASYQHPFKALSIRCCNICPRGHGIITREMHLWCQECLSSRKDPSRCIWSTKVVIHSLTNPITLKRQHIVVQSN